jgi:hypothetical protein
LAAALAVHAALWVGLPHDRRGAPSEAERPLEVLVEQEPAEPPSPTGAHDPALPAEAARRRDLRTGAARPPDESGRTRDIAPDDQAPAAALEPPSASSDALPSPLEPAAPSGLSGLSNDALGLGGRNVMIGHLGGDGGVASAGEAPAAGPPENVAPGIQASLRDALHEHDVELGLGAGGVLVGPAEEIARTSDTPWNSSAVLEVVADGSGQITGVRLVNVSEASEAWDRVAKALLGALRDRKLSVRPPGGHGVVVTIQVSSRKALPSGATPDSFPMPRVDQGQGAVSLPFDVADIGARARRSVHAHVVRERTF